MILWLAPMDWITNCAFRIIVKQIFLDNMEKLTKGNPVEKHWNIENENTNPQLFLRTEFMSIDGYIHNPSKVVRHLMATKYEAPLIAQIYGASEAKMVTVAQEIEKKYADRFVCIELNIWCPAPNVVKCGWWSSLMKDKAKTLHMIKSIKESISLPFSIKTRIWLNQDDIDSQTDFIVKASEYCKYITVHGRTYSQQHSWEVNRDEIYKAKKLSNPNCKIIGNWWIKSYAEIAEKIGNLDGVMIGQAAIWNPRIFTSHQPSFQEIWETIIQHLDLAIACELYFDKYAKSEHIQKYQDYIFPMPTMTKLKNFIKKIPILEKSWASFFAVPEFRKYMFSYVKGIPDSKDFKINTCRITKYTELVEEIKKFFQLG